MNNLNAILTNLNPGNSTNGKETQNVSSMPNMSEEMIKLFNPEKSELPKEVDFKNILEGKLLNLDQKTNTQVKNVKIEKKEEKFDKVKLADDKDTKVKKEISENKIDKETNVSFLETPVLNNLNLNNQFIEDNKPLVKNKIDTQTSPLLKTKSEIINPNLEIQDGMHENNNSTEFLPFLNKQTSENIVKAYESVLNKEIPTEKNIEKPIEKSKEGLSLVQEKNNIIEKPIIKSQPAIQLKARDLVQNISNSKISEIPKEKREVKETKKDSPILNFQKIEHMLNTQPLTNNDVKQVGKLASPMMENKNNVIELPVINLKSAPNTEVINKISSYIIESQVANKPTLDLKVDHQELGQFNIQVTRTNIDQNNKLNSSIDLNITTNNKVAHDFFQTNEGALIKDLNNAGINLSQVKITSTQIENNPIANERSFNVSNFAHNFENGLGFSSTSNQQSSQSFQQSNQQNNQQHSQSYSQSSTYNSNLNSDGGRDRRQELWNQYREKLGA